MKKLLCLLWLMLLVPLSQAQSAYTLDQVFTKMDEVAKTFRSSQADLERTHVTVIVNDKDVAFGKFYYTRKGKEPRVKMELTKPSAQLALVDKGKVQLYTPNLKQVQEASLGDHKDSLEMFMALAFGTSSEDIKKNFMATLAGEESIDGQKTTVLELKPKSSGIQSVRMWMDQKRWVAVQIRVTEGSNDYFILRYRNIKLNSSIPESVFQLKLPKDVRVLKM
jgi:outer membrane lipoprotein-sorting protein